jgi:hypothetical protein
MNETPVDTYKNPNEKKVKQKNKKKTKSAKVAKSKEIALVHDAGCICESCEKGIRSGYLVYQELEQLEIRINETKLIAFAISIFTLSPLTIIAYTYAYQCMSLLKIDRDIEKTKTVLERANHLLVFAIMLTSFALSTYFVATSTLLLLHMFGYIGINNQSDQIEN